jgi:hypothetical protein
MRNYYLRSNGRAAALARDAARSLSCALVKEIPL